MSNVNKIILAIVLGATIIGVFIFSAITDRSLIKDIIVQNSAKPTNSNIVTNNDKVTNDCLANNYATVTKVIDGDTLIVEGGHHIRLLGIDSDEKNYPCYQSAKDRLEELVLNKKVELEKDYTDVDMYGRCLRTVFLGDKNIDVLLVAEGLAVARSYNPDTKHSLEISRAEKQAIENKVGCKWNK